MFSADTLFIGKNFLQFPELASTNSCAQELIATTNPSEGTVITAVKQSAGKGQSGNSWESATGQNVTMSVILYPHFLPVQQQFWLNRAVSLGIRDAVAQLLNRPVKLKWPNDIYIKDKKVAGILIQNSLAGQKIQSCIVGIGLNVNQTTFLSDAPNPTSLQLETGQIYDLNVVLETICKQLEIRYLQLKSHQFSALENDYLQHLYRYQQSASFVGSDGVVFNGKITGVTEMGLLKIATEQGERKFNLKEVKFL